MKKCPRCGQWTLDFSEYFERFRCLNSNCGWMAPSSVERAIKLNREFKNPKTLLKQHIKELNLEVTAMYDEVNDALILDFGLGEPSYELPEGDGRMIWMIGRNTRSVAGFILLEASQRQVEELHVRIFARSKLIEKQVQSMPIAISSSRPSQVLIEKVMVASKEIPASHMEFEKYNFIFEQALAKIKQYNGQYFH